MVLVGSVLLFYRAPKSSTPIPLVPSRRNCAVPKPTTITLTSFCQDLSRRAGSPTLTTLPPSFTPARERRRPPHRLQIRPPGVASYRRPHSRSRRSHDP